MSVGKRVKDARKAAGLSQVELAKKIGVTQPTISELERGESYSSSHLITIAAVCAVDPHWLLNGNHQEQAISVKETSKNYIVGSFDVWDSSTELSDDEIEVPFFKEVELSAGSGSEVLRQDSGYKLRFAKSTFKNNNIQPELAACVTVSGNSMEPVLPDKATVGIDTGNTKVKDGDIYAIDHDGMLRVKILHRLPGGGIKVRSFNRDDYPDEDYFGDSALAIKVLGRVFWYSVIR